MMDTGSIMANQMDDLISAGLAQKEQEELLEKNNIFFVEEQNESVTECFERLFIGGKVLDNCLLKLGKDEYGIIKLHRVNCDWMRLVSVFRLEKLQLPPEESNTEENKIANQLENNDLPF